MKTAPFIHKRITRPSLAGAPCPHRRRAVSKGRSRTVVDDSGTLAITAWTCTDCGELVEELRLLSRDGTAETRPVRYYAVAPQSRFSAVEPRAGRS